MTREEIIKEFDKAGVNFDYANHKEDGRTANWIDDDFKTVLDLVEKLVSKNESLHLVSQQSELLIDYMKWFDDNRDMYYMVSNKGMINKYIKSINCG